MASSLATALRETTQMMAEKVDHTKICEILKNTYLCLGPLTKMYFKVIHLLRKSQVGIYMEKGKGTKKSNEIDALTPEQIEVLDECYKSCLDYQKMDLNKDTFFAYLCTGRNPEATFFHKKQLNKVNKKGDKKGKNKKGHLKPQSPSQEKSLENVDQDPAKAFLDWKEKTQKMFNIYEHLTGKRSKMEEIIKHVDPSKKTCLSTLFKSKECDKCQKVVEDLTENLTKVDYHLLTTSTICACGCFQSSLGSDEDGKGVCRCEYCGRSVDEDSASLSSLSNAEKVNSASSLNLPSSDLPADPSSSETKVSLCRGYVRVKGEDSASVLDLLSKHSLEWDYSAVQVDPDTLNVSMTTARGMSSDPGFKEKVQSLLSVIGSSSAIGEALDNIQFDKNPSSGVGKGDPPLPFNPVKDHTPLITKNKKKRNKKHQQNPSNKSLSEETAKLSAEVTVKASLVLKVPDNLKVSMEGLGLIQSGCGSGGITEDNKPHPSDINNFRTETDLWANDEKPFAGVETCPNPVSSSSQFMNAPPSVQNISEPLKNEYIPNEQEDESNLDVVFVADKSSQTDEEFFESSYSILGENEKEVEFGETGVRKKRKIKIEIS